MAETSAAVVAPPPPPVTPEMSRVLGNMLAFPEQQRANPTVEAARRVWANGQAERALTLTSGESVPYTKEDTDRALLFRLSSARSADTGEKVAPTDTQEKRRFGEAKAVVDSARAYLENGTIDNNIKIAVTAYLERSSPAFRDIVVGLRAQGGNDLDVFIVGLLKNPYYRDQLRTRFVDVLNPSTISDREKTVKQLETEIAELAARLGSPVSEADLQKARHSLQTAESALTAKAADELTLGVKKERFVALERSLPNKKRRQAEIQTTFPTQVHQLETLETDLQAAVAAANAADITRIQGEINTLLIGRPELKELKTIKAEITERDTLKTEIGPLETGIQTVHQKAEQALRDLQELERQAGALSPQERSKIEAQLDQKRADLADAKILLEAEMMKFYRDVTHMPADAMKAFVDEGLGSLKTAWQEEARKQAAKDKTAEGALTEVALEKISSLWKKSKIEKGLKVLVVDKDKAKTYFAEVLQPDGEAKLVDKILASTDDELKEIGMTDPEIAVFRKKMTDPEFKKAQGDRLAKEALSDYLLAGGSVANDKIVKQLASSAWGRNLIKEATARVQEMRDVSKELLDKVKEVSQPSVEISKKWVAIGAAILALLIALGFVVGPKVIH